MLPQGKMFAFGLAALSLLLPAGCKTVQTPKTSVKELGDGVSSGGTQVDEVSVDVGNGTSFMSKIKAVESATKTIEMQYFLFGNDFAGDYMAMKLVERAKAGVKVRLIVDAKTTLPEKKFFQALVYAGQGNLQIAYFRPIPADVAADLKALGFQDIDSIGDVIATGQLNSLESLMASNTYLRDKANAKKLLVRFVAVAAMALAPTGELTGTTAQEVVSAGFLDDPMPALKRLQTALVREVPGATFNPISWFDLTKWNHHKLLIVDGNFVQGGGRNLEDAYHWEKDDVLRTRHNISKYIFMDADYRFENPALASRALATYDEYWACATGNSCRAAIPQELEVAGTAEVSDPILAEVKERADEFESTRDYERSYEPIHAGTFTSQNTPVRYVENRMFPGSDGGSLLHEEKSEHAQAAVDLINGLQSGQEVVLHNAYLYIPASVLEALIKGLNRGVKLTIYSNSAVTSDLNYIPKAARAQYERLLTLWPSQVQIFEYMTSESLHAKVWIIGDTLMVGSVNADPRCELLDTGNSVIIGPPASGPSIASQYGDWIRGLGAKLLTDTVRGREGQAALRQVTLQLLAAEYQAANAPSTTPPSPAAPALEKIKKWVMEQTRIGFEDSNNGRDARRKLDALFIQF